MSALVLGGAGFIGSHLVERLLHDGRAVVVIDDLSSGRLANLADARRSGGDLQIHQHRLGDDGTVDLVRKARPEVLYHFTPTSRPAQLRGLIDVLDAAVVSDTGRVVVALDAAAVYRPSPDRRRLVEADAAIASVEGIGARAVLDALAAYREDRSVEYVALAVAGVYGPRMVETPATALMHRAIVAATGGEACVLRAESVQHDLVYIDDVVDALVLAGERGSGLLLNVGSGDAATAEQIAWAATGVGADISSAVGERAPQRQLILDVNRARIHLGWRPFTDLGEGLRASVDAGRGEGSSR